VAEFFRKIKMTAIARWAVLLAMSCAISGAQELAGNGGHSAHLPAMAEAGKRFDAVKAARRRAFHIIPVYHWQRNGLGLVPLSNHEKAELAWDESADRFMFVKAAFAMGISEWANTPGAWAGGPKGVGQRYAASVAGSVSDNFFSTFLFPAAFHQDPRYLNAVGKPPGSQVWYAATRVLVTSTDNGRQAINFSQLLGNLASAALTNTYYPPRERTAENTFIRWGLKLGVGAGMNVARQFLRPLRHGAPAPSVP
jgi:hypothetical protein